MGGESTCDSAGNKRHNALICKTSQHFLCGVKGWEGGLKPEETEDLV